MRNIQMKSTKKIAILGLAAAGAMAGAPAMACDGDGSMPYLSSICLTSWAKTAAFNNAFMPADGSMVAISTYTQLYAVIGTTYGTATGKFGLPNLSGRAVLGAGQSAAGPTYNVGATGGQFEMVLSSSQLPAHQHTLNQNGNNATIAVGIGSLTASTTLLGLSATTSLNNVSGSTSLSGIAYSSSSNQLNLMAAAAGPAGTSPAGKALGPTALAVYSGNTPGAAMASGSISGNLSLTVSGNAPVTLNGTPSTTFSGGTASTTISGTPAAYVGGLTGPAGSSGVIATLPPYLVLNYYIAYQGAFPVSN
jgi:microcystin-dependent protein